MGRLFRCKLTAAAGPHDARLKRLIPPENCARAGLANGMSMRAIPVLASGNSLETRQIPEVFSPRTSSIAFRGGLSASTLYITRQPDRANVFPGIESRSQPRSAGMPEWSSTGSKPGKKASADTSPAGCLDAIGETPAAGAEKPIFSSRKIIRGRTAVHLLLSSITISGGESSVL
jgi:hypothetical protein